MRPTIGVLAPYVGGYYYASVLGGIQRVARDRGARVVAFQTMGLEVTWPGEPQTNPLGWERIDGWIGINDLCGTAYYERIVAAGKPFVAVSFRLPAPGVCSVLPDNHGAITAAVRHLLEHGHRRIGFVGGLNQNDLRERHEGYLAALNEAGITVDPALYFSTSSTHEDDGRAVARQLIALGLPCTALVVATDTNALGVMHELQAAGHRVPDDVAIVGFDDIEQAQYASPPLATMRVPFEVVSARAAEVLLSRIIDGVRPPEVVRVGATLVTRPSCGCVRAPYRGVSEALRPDASEQERCDALARLLVEAVTEGASAGPKRTLPARVLADVAPAASALAVQIEALLRGEPALSSSVVRRAWQRLLGVAHDVETVEGLLVMLEQAVTGRVQAGADECSGDRVREILRPLRHQLMLAWRTIEQNRARYRESNAQANRKIDLALIGADLATTQELSWLRWARVRHAMLGEWRMATSTSPRRLVVKSTFNGGDGQSHPVGEEHSPSRFPCAELCETLDGDGEDILSVVPITGGGHNRGLLAVVGPIELEIDDDTGNLAQWAALLSAAMDRDELLVSLRQAAETLRRSEERYALAAHGANDGLWDWDATSGRLYISPRWKAILGYTDDEIGSDVEAWFSRVHPDDLPTLRDALTQRVEARQPHFEHEYRMAHKDGRWVWVLSRGVIVVDEKGRPIRLAGSQTDVTARKEAEENLRRSALHDALTGLPNRAFLLDRLDRAIERARGDSRARFAVLFLDLDNFKTLNDSLGHLIGDQLLIQIAQRLCRCLRANDAVARLGGDEFAIIVADIESDDAASTVAERVQEVLRAPFQIGEHRVFTSASVGIALSSERYRRAEDFLRDADTAMYRAKSQGRGRHQLFDGHMHDQAMERLSVEAGLRRALERREFSLHYQPVVALETGEIVGVEALIRWEHPEQGLLTPASFLSIAEESGLIVPISEWVIGAACDQARAWQEELSFSVPIGVNVPPQQLKDPHLVECVSEHLRRTGLDPSVLGLELVESSLIENRGATVANLEKLRAMGIRISIDDFGTGYSSLSYLKRLPLDALKIDRSFTQGIPDDPNDTAICTTIIAMARSLNLDVVAEGVETPEQAAFLRANGCRKAQGYYFSRALPAAQCLGVLRGAHESTRVARSSRRLIAAPGRGRSA